MDDLEESYACGLDLGTTFSCIGVYKNGGVEIVPNTNGDRITPSIVTILDENKILIGEETIDHLVENYDSSIYAIKRFIGRNFKDKNIKKEIEKEKFPFTITEEENHLVVEVNKKKKIKFKLEEISSFIIRKMVENAELYTKRKINKIVITVPANFNDSQRNCTKQAAELAGLEVLRIINEPTAASLAYGLQENNDKDKDKNGNILVFDLGGGTFDVTILKIIEEDKKEKDNKKDEIKNKKYFEILSTSGDKFLGGEDFDNELVDYALEKFHEKYKIEIEEIRKDKKAIKKLKIACENIKRVLSDRDRALLCVNNFYNKQDIYLEITRKDFELMCKELFKKLMKPLDDALILKNIKKESIKEIVLVGGSTRIPKIERFLRDYFPGSKINNSIDPDETVAYGATLIAAKILFKKDNFTSGFNLMDITPLSLGTDVANNSKDKEIQKEGLLMSVIIKKGSSIPINNEQFYYTSYDNQDSVSINVYEGDKKYVKYNHLLKKASLNGLTKKPKGKVKIKINYRIDESGILYVTGTEEGNENNSKKLVLKNDGIILTDEEITKLKKKNEKFFNENSKTKIPIDYNNIKETLIEYEKAYKENQEDEDKFNILMGKKLFLEEFINNFSPELFEKKNFNEVFDNETMIEKFYLYIKELFDTFVKLFSYENNLDRGEKNEIKENIKKYIYMFIMLNSGYLDDLIEIIKGLKKKDFYEIIVYIMEQFKENGINCLRKMEKFCRYNSLKYFEKTMKLFKNHIVKLSNLLVDINLQKKCKLILDTSTKYIEDINSCIILLCEDALKNRKIIPTKPGFTGFTKKGQKLVSDNEQYQITLETYEKIYPDYEGKGDEKEAIILSNMIILNYKYLENKNYKLYNRWGEICLNNLKKVDPKPDWYRDFYEIYEEIKNKITPEKRREELGEEIIKKYKKEFDKIKNKFDNKKNNVEFFDFILSFKPYNGYEDDLKNKKDFKNESQELLLYLKNKYNPNDYTYNPDDEKSQLNYFLIEYIDEFLNNMYSKI